MSLRRWQLFEFNEAAWLPSWLREELRAIIEYLTTPYYGELVAPMARLIAQTGQHHFFDLASGNGGPWLRLQPALLALHHQLAIVTLSDLYPAPESTTHRYLAWYESPVDMTRELPDVQGALITVFNSFHHLNPQQAQAFLAQIASRRCRLLIVEATRREQGRIWRMVAALLQTFPVGEVLKRGRMHHQHPLASVALLPCLWLMLVWDSSISVLRTYHPSEVSALLPEAISYRLMALEGVRQLQTTLIEFV
jgi:hypothetical protein